MTDIELIKSKLDIVDVIGTYVKDMKRAGANYKAPCPFHQEKTPSFMVNPSLQIFKCFGCGKAGDVISFIEEIERVEFPEALRIAAEKAGIQLHEISAPDKKENEEKKRLIEANTLAAKFYHYILQSHELGKPGREYAQKRKIDAERIKTFMMGYAPYSLNNLKKFLISKGFKENELVKWGLLVERKNGTIDKFRQRLMHPIFNLKGEVVAFSGRYIGKSKEAPKYLNSPETLVYKKNEMLYGLFQAKDFLKQYKFLIVVEGNVDILSAHRVGYGNIVAPLGTAFTLNQAKLIKRFSDEIYFCFDTDSAGIKALIRGIGLAEEIELKHKVIDLSGYQDADELICKAPDEWPKRVAAAKNTIEYLINKLSDDLDMGTADGKGTFTSRIIPILKLVRDEVLLSHYIKLVAVLLEVSDDIILRKVRSQKTVHVRDADQHIEQPTEIHIVDRFSKSNKYRNAEKELLELLIHTNKLFTIDINENYFQDEMCGEIFKGFIDAGEEADFGAVAEGLRDDTKKLLEEIIMFDISNVKDPEKSIAKSLLALRKNYLEKETLKLKKLPDDDAKLDKLNELVKEKRKLENKIKN